MANSRIPLNESGHGCHSSCLSCLCPRSVVNLSQASLPSPRFCRHPPPNKGLRRCSRWGPSQPLQHSCSSSSLSSLELSDTKVHEPYIRALLGTASRFCEVVVLKLRTVPNHPTLSSQPTKPTTLFSKHATQQANTHTKSVA